MRTLSNYFYYLLKNNIARGSKLSTIFISTKTLVAAQYLAIGSSKPDHRAVGSDAVLFLSHSWLIVAVNSRANFDNIAARHGAVDRPMLRPVTALYRTLCSPTINATFNSP